MLNNLPLDSLTVHDINDCKLHAWTGNGTFASFATA